MVDIVDTAQSVYNLLKTDERAAATLALLVSGASSIYESGDLTPDMLNDLEDARRTGGNLNLALAISIQDAGESRHEHNDKTVQEIVIRVYDRQRGYTNIRAVRVEVMKLIKKILILVLTSGKKRGTLSLSYVSRTGHLYDERFGVEFEAIVYSAIVVTEED